MDSSNPEAKRRLHAETGVDDLLGNGSSDCLQLGHVCLKENTVGGTTAEHYVITKQRAIVGHDKPLCS